MTLALGVAALLVVLVVPLPTVLLDAPLAISITVSVLVLMVALFLRRPLDFTSFPTLLLLTTLLRLALPEGLARYVVAKGSLAVDGVSLTVAEIAGDEVTIGLIPETLARTTLGRRHVGDRVNLEVDVLAKYVEKLTASLLPGAEDAR